LTINIITGLSILQKAHFYWCMRSLGSPEKRQTTGDEFVCMELREV